MYVPRVFAIDDPAVIAQFIDRYSFATIVSCAQGKSIATHAPVMLRGPANQHGQLLFHLARANSQWQHFCDPVEVLVIFTGPHAYVSPSWYQSTPNVPTWNYTAVHVYGTGRVIDNHAQLVAMLEQLVAKYESNRAEPWPYDIPTDYRDRLIQAIVGVELKIERIEAKFKLNQNRAHEIDHVRAALLASSRASDRELGEFMRHLDP